MIKTVREWRGLPLLFALPLLLSACSPSAPAEGADSESHETTILDYDATVAEYTLASESLPLPDGESYPDAPFARTDELYQEGFGRNQAVYLWNCAWGREWLSVRGQDDAKAAEALKMYASVRETDTYRQSWDPSSMQKPFESALEAAELGDASKLQEDVTVNCPA